MRLHLDFETKSELDVKEVGASVYARHPSTDILCIGYAVDDEPIEVLKNGEWEDCIELVAERLYVLAENPNVVFVAHNASFEQAVWRHIMVERYDFPEIPVQRWRCTAAKAAYMGLPRDLAGVGEVLKLPIQKSSNRAIMKLCRPRRITKKKKELDIPLEKFWTPETAPEDFAEMYEYNRIDVETERLVDKALPDLNTSEQEMWFIDQIINARGVKVDIPMVKRALEFIAQTTAELLARFREIVEDQFESPNQLVKFKEWLSSNGLELSDLQAATVDRAIRRLPDGHVKEALEIRRALSKISTAKYQAFLDRVDPHDMRLRDILLYCAAHTHRFGGRGVQIQNMPRGTVNSDIAISIIQNSSYSLFKRLYPDPMAAYSSSIRGMLIADDGMELLVSDLDSIEARGTAWLSHQKDLLEAFERGEDVYCAQAESIFSIPGITKKSHPYERSVGKVAVLALGYAGGIGAFGTMARGYDVDLHPAWEALFPTISEEEEVKARKAYKAYLARTDDDDPLDLESGLAADIIKQRWRIKNHATVSYWTEINDAAITAVLTREKTTVGGLHPSQPKIIFGCHKRYLLCRLPSGNCIAYPFPRVSMRETPWGKQTETLTYETVDSEKSYKWVRTHTYGGKIVENVVQSLCRDLLVGGIKRCEYNGYNVVFHTHDEIASEVPKGFGSVEEHQKLLAASEPWAVGLPVDAHGFRTIRYRK